MHTSPAPAFVGGGGPAGLAATIALASRGVEALLVDRRIERSSLPRATTVSTRTMELVRSWGLEDRVLAGGVDVDWLMWRMPPPPQAADGGATENGGPA